ncbi:MAG: DEAD/DEAH box helicase [Gemmatimonadota bacterium]|jgi:ATP-dependent RNA helicase RhlE|nr:DEAD/DEAH box helicase [Gemmatimonadota bacterium]
MTFDEFGLHPKLTAAVAEMGFTRPTGVQAAAIPPALEGRDVLACAMTGSGKTAAFLLPVLNQLLEKPRGRTRVLVISPTRELAAQIHEHFQALAKHTGLTGAAIFGGVGMKPQEDAFRRQVDVIVATPGRLLDHLQYDYAKLDGIEFLVLDEADRMLDMGYLPDVSRILSHLPVRRQTLFFSATMPPQIVELSGQMLTRPARVDIERQAKPATGVKQALYPVSAELKSALFLELLKRGDVGNVIVFCRTKHRSNRLAEFLDKQGVPNARIHGNRSQTARTDALAGFRSGRYRVLVATDIVARGIDVEALEHVVNFDVPNQPEDYIHRVGRTARAEATGDAYTLFSPDEEKLVRGIEKAIGQTISRVMVPGFDYRAKPEERFEVPIGERIAEIRRRKAEERQRAREKAERKAQREAEDAARATSRSGRPGGPRRSADGQGASSGSGRSTGGSSGAPSRTSSSRSSEGSRNSSNQRRPGNGPARPGSDRSDRGSRPSGSSGGNGGRDRR